jgi:hypothetical protein
MKTFRYRWFHIPTGQSGETEHRFESSEAFLDAVAKWNNQQPSQWLYAPI